ncbi:NAD(P)/FAD-dependent oxidoreductase [Oxyplasma meridianum]|uniref:NAD(P)/FAD-dependent oxidoreductase n=1 Tax=Oxyplasma meridianum TaxID=3073602 RepID=A0AAX4NG44_9ARCH
MRYDVVIIGSGPAGSEAGKILGSKGFKTAIIDSRNEIGNPIRCEELTRESIMDFLKVSDHENIMSNRFEEMLLSFDETTKEIPLRIKNDRFVVFERDKFDKENAAKASLNGCDIFIRTLYLSHSKNTDGEITVNARKGNINLQFICRFLLNASGETGRETCIPDKIKVKSHRVFLNGDYSRECRFSIQYDKKNIMWYIPKRKPEANLGIAYYGDQVNSDNPDSELNFFIKKITGKERFFSTFSFTWESSHPETSFTDGEAMLYAGDAAGLRDPIIPFGFDRSIESGNMAGEAIASYLENSQSDAVEIYKDEFLVNYIKQNRSSCFLFRSAYGEIEEKIKNIKGGIEIPHLSSYALFAVILGREI